MDQQPISSMVYNLLNHKELVISKVVPLNEIKDHKGEPIEKIINFWRRNGLTPFIQKGEWMKISFTDLIWLRMLDDLRKINFPMERMKVVSDYFFKDAYDDDLPKKNLQQNRKMLQKKKTAGTIEDEELQIFEYINTCLASEELLYALKFSINYLTNLCTSVITTGEDGIIYIFFSGLITEFIGDKPVGHKNDRIDFTAPHIRLSIKHYFKEFLDDETLSGILAPQLLNDDELKVMKEIRRRKVDVIIIKLSASEKMTISTSKSGVVKAEDLIKLLSTLGLGNYESLTFSSIDEKSFSFTKTRKKI